LPVLSDSKYITPPLLLDCDSEIYQGLSNDKNPTKTLQKSIAGIVYAGTGYDIISPRKKPAGERADFSITDRALPQPVVFSS
jgi:hypothetical protein